MADIQHDAISRADSHPPPLHASDHTDGTDDIQSATGAQKGLATAAQITKLNGIATGATDDTTVNAHTGDTSDAHDAAAISYAGGTGMSATDVEAAVDELATEKANASDLTAHTGDTSDAHDASAISFVPAGAIAATDVQAAIEEVATEAGASTSGHVIKDEGTARTQRANLNFIGSGVTATDNSGTGATDVTIPGATGGATDLDGLSDVVISSPATRQGLFHNGTNFVNQNAPGQFVAPVAKTATFTALLAERAYYVDATSGAVTANLPTAVGNGGKEFFVKKTDLGTNTVTLDPNSTETINGASTLVLSTQDEGAVIESDNSNWFITSRPRGGDTTTGTGAGFTPPWVKTGSGVIYAAHGDGNPAHLMDLYQMTYDKTNASLTATTLTTSKAVARKFRLPKALSVTDVFTFSTGATTGIFRLGIYPVGSGTSRLWDSGTFNTTANTWVTALQGLTPFLLAADTDYWFCVAATSTSATGAFVTVPNNQNSAFMGADAAPLGGRAQGMGDLVSFSVTSGVLPSTLPSLTALAGTPGTPIAWFGGTAS